MWIRAMLITVLVVTLPATRANRPLAILEVSDGLPQPHMAIFEKPNRQAVLIGCETIRKLWEAVPVKKVSAVEYQETLQNQDEVVDLHCKHSPDAAQIRKYQSTSEPGSIVLKPRGSAQYQRHYVHPAEWWDAFAGSPQALSVSDLITLAPKRGPGLTSYKWKLWCLRGFSWKNDATYGQTRDIKIAEVEDANKQAKEWEQSSRKPPGFPQLDSDIVSVIPYACPCDKVRRPSKREPLRCQA